MNISGFDMSDLKSMKKLFYKTNINQNISFSFSLSPPLVIKIITITAMITTKTIIDIPIISNFCFFVCLVPYYNYLRKFRLHHLLEWLILIRFLPFYLDPFL